MKLLPKIKDYFSDVEDLYEMKSAEVQDFLAPQILDLAVKNLREGKGVVAKSFRGEYLPDILPGKDFETYLDIKAKGMGKEAWGTDIEFASICEALGVNGVVTPVKGSVEQKPICIYNAGPKAAATIHLYNDGTHWWAGRGKPEKTKGNGKCLYNAIAKVLKSITKKEDPRAAFKQTISTTRESLFGKEDQKARSHQAAIFAAIADQPTADKLAEQMDEDRWRISLLPKEEQLQIAEDYQVALKLARDEMVPVASRRMAW